MQSVTEHPQDLLPWYVNGTLQGDERAQVEAHLETCAACRQEVEFLRGVRDSIQREQVSVPGELGLQRLLREVRRDPAERRSRHTRWIAAYALAASVVIVLQAAVLVNLWQQPQRIVPLSGPVIEGVVYQVGFAPQATEAEIRALLLDVNARLIDGPGATGLYRIELIPDPEGEEALSARIERLRVHPELITYLARE